jgi:hypothetical protein
MADSKYDNGLIPKPNVNNSFLSPEDSGVNTYVIRF